MSAGAWLQSPNTVVRYIHMWTKTRLSDWQIIAISGLRIWNMLPAPSHLVRALKYICLIAAADLRRGLVTIFIFKVPCYLLIRNERKWVDLVTLTFGLLTAQVLVMCGTIVDHTTLQPSWSFINYTAHVVLGFKCLDLWPLNYKSGVASYTWYTHTVYEIWTFCVILFTSYRPRWHTLMTEIKCDFVTSTLTV